MTSQQRDSVLQQRRQRWSQNHGNSGEHECEAGEHIADWIEQFELVASVFHWDDRTKLVNLTTRLRDQAFAFYQSCSTQQRNDYKTVVSELAAFHPSTFGGCTKWSFS